jgi:NTP pyrophosphatase (non-canonical NTP hydrolase)
MMQDLIERIRAWKSPTGEHAEGWLFKLNEEVGELNGAYVKEKPRAEEEGEVADVLICLILYAMARGIDPVAVAQTKMSTNESRTGRTNRFGIFVKTADLSGGPGCSWLFLPWRLRSQSCSHCGLGDDSDPVDHDHGWTRRPDPRAGRRGSSRSERTLMCVVPSVPDSQDRRPYAVMLRAFRAAGATEFCANCFCWVTPEHGCAPERVRTNPTQRLGTLKLISGSKCDKVKRSPKRSGI